MSLACDILRKRDPRENELFIITSPNQQLRLSQCHPILHEARAWWALPTPSPVLDLFRCLVSHIKELAQ